VLHTHSADYRSVIVAKPFMTTATEHLYAMNPM
jgi:hypothetical protein